MNKFLFLTCVLLCLHVTLPAANNPRIKGKIVDAGSQAPIDFADVLLFVKGADQPVSHVIPDVNGLFSIPNVKDGEYSLLVKLVGYDVLTRSDIVLSAQTPVLDLGILLLKPLEVGLAEVEVVAQKKQIIYKLDKRVIEASSSMLASGGSAVDILENTPSIRVDAEGNVSFRGSGGFSVYIDGKPSVFSGTQALEQIPAGHIDNIEIITTPSARYDTEGDVGIINVITKKHSLHGLSGIINLTGSTIHTRGVDFLLTRQNKNYRWYFGGLWTDRLRKSDFRQQKTTIVSDTTTTSYSDGPRRSDSFNRSLKAGWLHSAPKTDLYIDLEGGYGGTERRGELDYKEERSAGGSLFDSGEYSSRDYYHIDETYFHGTVGANHKFNKKGHELKGSVYVKYGGDALEYFQSDLYDENNVRQQGHRAYEDEFRWTVRVNADYVNPYRETGRFEAGYQYFSYLEDGDYSMEFWDPVKSEFYWSDDIYNTFYFQHGINSVYVLVSDSYKSFNYQVGLRGEHTHRVLESSIEGADRRFNHFDLFPSVHLGFNLPHEQQLMASYSRRITRPQLFYMEPYITYRDYYSAEIGNPDIRAEYIDSYELNYKLNLGEKSLTASAFHRKRKDKIERLRVPYEAGVTLDSMANVGNDYSTGLELSAQLPVFRWWNMNVNGSLYHYKVVNKLSRSDKNETSTNYEIAWNNSFELGKYTRVQLDGNFVGPSVTTQGKTDAFWYANMAVRQQMLQRKLTATLSFRDVFNSARYVSNITTADLQSGTRIKPKYPLISLTLSYTFNNYRARSGQTRAQHDLFEGTNH